MTDLGSLADKRLLRPTMTDNPPHRIGVIGVGSMGKRHAETLASHSAFDIRAVADVDAEAVRSVAAETNSTAYHSHDELLEESLDAVVIATPEPHHVDPTVAATARDLDILLEKPVAHDPDDEVAILEAVSESESSVLLGFTLRFDTRYGAVKNRIDAGALGDIVALRAERSVITEEAKRLSRADPLLYQTIHDVDMACWLVGEPIDHVYATSNREVHDDPVDDDVIHSLITFTDGTVLALETGSILPANGPAPNRAHLGIKGTKGTAEVRTPDRDLELATDRTEHVDSTVFPTVNGSPTGAIRTELDHFERIVAGKVDPLVSVRGGMYAAAVGRATRRSIRTGTPEPLDPPIDLSTVPEQFYEGI